MTLTVRKPGRCLCCQRSRPIEARRLCGACYGWFWRHGFRGTRNGLKGCTLPVGRKPWTAGERQNAFELYRRGLSTRQISWVLGRKWGSIRCLFRDHRESSSQMEEAHG
jgi:hypothetical protein